MHGEGVRTAEGEATSPAATVSEAIRSRHSCRAFSRQPVDPATVRDILEVARFAPSGGNLQPWLVHVLSGETLSRFRTWLEPKLQALPSGGATEYPVYPPDLQEPYRSRRRKCGEDLYSLVGVARDDRAGKLRQFARNYDFFGAPVGMFFFVDRCMGSAQWSDIGMFMQNIMLLARERGLATCPQEAWAVWHLEVAEFLGVEPRLMLFCGLALGVADGSAPINRLRTERTALDGFVKFHE